MSGRRLAERAERMRTGEETIIGAGLSVEGELVGDDPVTIAGRLKGRVAVTRDLTVERGAVVEADVDAEVARIGGTVTGRVRARARVELAAEAVVHGDLHAPRVHIADGARFRGQVEMA
jgi:cytoskeletal protein CcmA (bactofilin family)